MNTPRTNTKPCKPRTHNRIPKISRTLCRSCRWLSPVYKRNRVKAKMASRTDRVPWPYCMNPNPRPQSRPCGGNVEHRNTVKPTPRKVGPGAKHTGPFCLVNDVVFVSPASPARSRPARSMVRASGFQPEDRGSIPRQAI